MKLLKNLKIQYKLFIAFGFFVFMLFAFVIFAAQQFSYADTTYRDAVRRQINLSEALGNLTLLRFNNMSTAFTYYGDELADSLAGLRNIDYVKLCDSFLQNIHHNRDSILQDGFLSFEQKQDRLNRYYRIEHIFSDRFIDNFNLIKDGVSSKNVTKISTGIANAYKSATEITSMLNGLYDSASYITSAKTNELSSNSKKILYSLFTVSMCIMIISILVSIFIGKMIMLPISEMEKAMIEISSGNLNYSIRSEYRDELGALSNRIGDMVDEILEMNKAVAAIDYLDTMIYVTDLDYNLIYINRRLATTFTIDRDNFKMKKCYKTLRNRDFPCEICQMPMLLPDKDSFPLIDYRDTWDDVLGTWIGGRASIIRWTDGNVVHYQTIHDETQQKQYEERLQKAAQVAEAASISKTTFLANMSHEIRTPMNSIIGFSELALDDDIPDKTRNYLNKIMLNSEGLLQIINDILDISKIESGKMELEKISFDLFELFIACRTIITPKADEKGVILHFYAEPSIGRKLIGDPVRLRQVLLNILSNAVKFTNAGGIVKISATINGLPNGDITINFEVKDSGIGMNPAQLVNISEPFIQAEVGITRKYGGTGLGLAIAKNIIELMGGMLNIESTLGVGSKFSFELTFKTTGPLEGDPGDARTRDIAIEKPRFNGEVLLCEDNHMNQQMLNDHLERVGLQVEVADNGKEGLDRVQRRVNRGQKPYDLILMDIHMPIMDGLEAASKIDDLGTGTPIVALTANIMAHDMELYLKNGMKDCLGKPFISKDLWRCLLKFLTPASWTPGSGVQNTHINEKLRNALVADFLKEHQGTYDKLTGALDEGDIKFAYRLVHTLKSNAGALGKTILQKAAGEVENLLADGKNFITPEPLLFLKNELNAALGALAALEEKGASPDFPRETEPYGTEKTRELLAELKPLLERGNPDCLKRIDALRGIPESEKLIQQMEDLDFKLATETLAELLG